MELLTNKNSRKKQLDRHAAVTKNSRLVRCSCLSREHRSILFAVVLTALITRHAMTISSVGMMWQAGELITEETRQKQRSSSSSSPFPLPDMYSFETIPSRTWKIYEHPFPCYPAGERLMVTTPTHEGILFQRPTKVGSTTMTNIVLRLAHNRGAEAFQNELRNRGPNATEELQTTWIKPNKRPLCKHRAMHQTSVELDYANRDATKSFLFSLVRDPTKRFISLFFHFVVTHGQVEPTDPNFQSHAIKPQSINHLIDALTFEPGLRKKMTADYKRYEKRTKPRKTKDDDDAMLQHEPPPLDYTKIVQDILDNYEFIAVTERMDESLVAMKLLLGLSVNEILYASASRSAGSFSNGPMDTRPCMYLIPAFLTKSMTEFFYHSPHNDRWIEYSKGDALLHRAASKSLDRTIDEVFGREFFEHELTEFRNAREYASAVCSSEPELVLGMCDDGGRSVTLDKNRTTTCYIWSEGCDHQCLNDRIPNPIPRSILDGTETFGR